MNNSLTYTSSAPSGRFSILLFFILIGLLRLTNFNFYLSQIVGFETTINATGGDAFNFINYIAVFAAAILFFGHWQYLSYNLKAAWPFSFLLIIYMLNAVLSPYADYNWVGYQILFILVGLLLHLHTEKTNDIFSNLYLKKGLSVIYAVGILFALFAALQILFHVSISHYISEFNESFVQSLDDFGIMKQRYGYFLGFLLAYTLFMVNNPSHKIGGLLVILATGFGIRSFILGALGGILLFVIRRPKKLLVTGIILTPFLFWSVGQYFDQGIYDTRFYPYLNALDIIQKFPFGVGLGGYPVYTEEFSRQLLANFYDVNSILEFVPIAPESDLVHLMGSLGWPMASLHLLIIARLLWLVVKFQNRMSNVEKCFCFYFGFMSFFGISEDSIFSINYWIFFGICSGLLANLAVKPRQVAYDS